jgi:dinuclear metal center YbgI/SA1388 family protein
VRVSDVCEAMEKWAPSGYAFAWDRTGLRIGDPNASVKSVLVCLTVDETAFRAAKKARACLIVSHHPVMWEPLKVLRTNNPQTRLYLDLAKAGIACYGSHTSLDIVADGVNDVLANRLGLQRVRPLFPIDHAAQIKLVTFVPESHLETVRNAVCDAGAGTIGAYTHCSFSAPGTGTFLPSEGTKPFSGKKHKVNEELERRFEVLVNEALFSRVLSALKAAHPYEEVAYDIVQLKNRDASIGLGRIGELSKKVSLEKFASLVRRALQIEHVRVTGDLRRGIRTVAVMGGAGGSSVMQVPGDVDTFVTGDLKYHDAHDALLRGLSVIDAGHHGTEKWCVPAIAEYLKRALKGLRVHTYMEKDPFVCITR